MLATRQTAKPQPILIQKTRPKMQQKMEPANGNGNGGAAAVPQHRPTTSDSTVEPDERADALEAYMAQIEAQQGALANQPKPEANSRCVLLEQLLTAASAADPNELHETRMETGHECSKWGALLRVHCVSAFDEEMQPVPEHIAGRIFVEFEQPDAAAECARAMDGRFFDGRRVSASFYPVQAFLNGDFSLEGAEIQQTAITWDDIVAMNSRPASSWDTMEGAPPPAPQSSSGDTAEPMEVEQPKAAAAAAAAAAASSGGGGGRSGGGRGGGGGAVELP